MRSAVSARPLASDMRPAAAQGLTLVLEDLPIASKFDGQIVLLELNERDFQRSRRVNGAISGGTFSFDD